MPEESIVGSLVYDQAPKPFFKGIRTLAGEATTDISVGSDGLLFVKNIRGDWDRVREFEIKVRGLEGWIKARG